MKWLNRAVILSLFLALINLITVTFFSAYFNYAAESINLVSLLRLANGQSWLPPLGEVPTLTNPYGFPIHILPFAVAKLFGLESVRALVIVARFEVLLLLSGLIWFIWREARSLAVESLNSTAFLFSVAVLLFFEPFYFFAYRPDFLAISLEVAAFFSVLRARRSLWITGALFGLALLVKPNHLGVFAGVIAHLLWSHQARKSPILIASFGFTILVGGFGLHVLFGPQYWPNVFHAANYGLVPAQQVPQILLDTVRTLILIPLPLHFLFYLGTKRIEKSRPGAGSLFLWTSLMIAVIGVFGQLKVGASTNYFYSYWALAMIPISIELTHAFRNFSEALKLPLFGSLIVLLFWACASLPGTANNIFNFSAQYPYHEVNDYLNSKYPNSHVYSNESSALVHLWKQSPIGPWDERAFSQSKYFQAIFTSELKSKMPKFSVAVIPGSGCENWTPTGPLAEGLGHLTHLEAKFKKLCVFGEK